MFPMSIHTAQPIVADRRNRTEAAAAHHRLARCLAVADDAGAAAAARPTAPWPRISLGGFRRPFRRVRRGAVA
jgi:hypothetical protein